MSSTSEGEKKWTYPIQSSVYTPCIENDNRQGFVEPKAGKWIYFENDDI